MRDILAPAEWRLLAIILLILVFVLVFWRPR
jgi:hypothetical protein